MISSPGTFIFIYILGGLTFLPLSFLIILLFYYFLWPDQDEKEIITFDKVSPEEQLNHSNVTDSLRSKDDAKFNKFGWLRITREYTPGAGSAANGSTFGNMMKQGFVTLMEGKHTQQKRSKDSFFVVLKYNTLFMYESEKQTQCKGVIIVSHHDVSVFPEHLPDNEIYSKTHSIRLTKKQSIRADLESDIDNRDYYLFCDIGVDKEDWYFSLQRSSKLKSNSPGPQPQVVRDKAHFDQSAMNNLLQTVYSNDDHYQTQWFNATLGRIFLGVYKTQSVQDYFVKKLVRKIKKAKKPNFLNDIHIKSVDVGNGVPFITNPKLAEITPNGDLDIDMNLDYRGCFRVEIETEAVIAVSRLKPLKVPLVLAVVLRRLQGKMLLRIKAPPTNRIWVGFYEMPKLDLLIEPVVSATQLKFHMVIKAIESKIQEMIMESVVLPNMDDTSFFNSGGMGGIFEGDIQTEEAAMETAHEPVKDNNTQEVITDSHNESNKSDQRAEKTHTMKPADEFKSEKHHSHKLYGEGNNPRKSFDSVKSMPGQVESIDESTTSKEELSRLLPKAESEPNLLSLREHARHLSPNTKDLSHSGDDSNLKSAPVILEPVNAPESKKEDLKTRSTDSLSVPSKLERWSRSVRKKSSRIGIAGILGNDTKASTSSPAPIPIVAISSASIFRRRRAVSVNSSPSVSPLGSPSGSALTSPSGSPSGSPHKNSPDPTPPSSPKNSTTLFSSSYPPKHIVMKPDYSLSVKSLPIIRDSSDDHGSLIAEGKQFERHPILDPPVDELNMVLG